MPPKKILLLSVSVGAGHMRAAEAIGACAAGHRALHLDVMNYVSSGFRKIYTDFYLGLIHHHPALWGYLYQLTNDAEPGSKMQKFRRAVEHLSTRALLKEIRDFAPDVIVCTHFLPAELLSREKRKGNLDCPVWVQVTDFDLHRMWVHSHIAGYLAANEEIAYRMRAFGLPAHTVHVTGIPIMPVFAQTHDRQACAREFGLDPARTTLLLMGGGAGLGSLDAVAARLLDVSPDFQLVALAGKNIEALAALQKIAARYSGRMLAQGYTDKVERLMACADLVVTKPGGLTVSECLAMGLPMIVNSPIPGQEERNADFLLEQGVALRANDAVTLEYRVRLLLNEPDRLAQMSAKARALGKPHAANAVLNAILGS